MLLSILGLAVDDSLQRINSLKVVLAGLVNLIAGLIFIVVAHVAWGAAGLIAAGSILGGLVAGRYGRQLSPVVLRCLIVIVGVLAIVRLL